MPTTTNPHIDRAVVEAERGGLAPHALEQLDEAKFLGVEVVIHRVVSHTTASQVSHEGGQ